MMGFQKGFGSGGELLNRPAPVNLVGELNEDVDVVEQACCCGPGGGLNEA